MAVPESLRIADPNIYRTAVRAAQLQNVKPIISYWCEYWILKQILAKGLHNSDVAVLDYSTELMDQLEETKKAFANEEALTDDMAGQAYVEQFAQETLDRAQRVVKAGKVTATTATTFDAAATFFGVVNVWGAPDAETVQKIKYAKWNAARILKAIRAGEDPNATNPKPEELLPQEGVDDSMAVAVGDDVHMESLANHPATVEDASDVDMPAAPHYQRRDSAGVSLPHSPASAGENAHSAPTTATTPAEDSTMSGVSPLLPPSSALGTTTPDTFYALPSQTPTSVPQVAAAAAPQLPSYPSQRPAAIPQPSATPAVPQPPPPSLPQAHASQHAPPTAAVDEMAIAGAQKHAKWAISALNFEDVPTAVRELQIALQLLGVS